VSTSAPKKCPEYRNAPPAPPRHARSASSPQAYFQLEIGWTLCEYDGDKKGNGQDHQHNRPHGPSLSSGAYNGAEVFGESVFFFSNGETLFIERAVLRFRIEWRPKTGVRRM